MFNLTRNDGYLWGVIVVIFLILYSPILINTTPFADDITRQAWGLNENIPVGRPLIELGADIVHMMGAVTDLRPTNQIVAILIFAVVGVLLAKHYGKNLPFYSRLAGGVLVAAPSFSLGNMAYSFDAPYMAAAMLSSVFASIYSMDSRRFITVIVIAFLLASLCLYQPAISVYIAMTAFTAASAQKSLKKISLYCFRNAILLLIALVIYILSYKFFMAPQTPSYAATHSQLNILNMEGIAFFASSAYNYATTIYFSGALKFAYATLAVIAIISLLRRDFLLFIMALFCVAVMMMAPFIIQVALLSPVFEMRSLFGFGVVFALLALSVKGRVMPVITALASLIILIWGGAMVGAFSSALTAQREHEHALIVRAMDIVYADTMGKPNVTVSGDAGLMAYAINVKAKYPQLRQMIYPVLSNAWLLPAIAEGAGFRNMKIGEHALEVFVGRGYQYEVSKNDNNYHIHFSNGGME